MEKKKKFKEPWLQRFIRTVFPLLEQVAPGWANRLFVYVFFTPFRHRAPQKEEACAREAALEYVPFNGHPLAVYAWGEGAQHVWVVHGWAGRATQFRKFIPALNRAGYKVIGFDGPGHGRSGGKQTNTVQFQQVFTLLAQKYGVPAAMIGHSFGGASALYAIAHGLQVTRLIEMGSPVKARHILGTYLRAIAGSPARIPFFEKFVVETFGKPFAEFTALHSIRQLPGPIDLLLVHDEDDRDVTIDQAELLVQHNPWVQFLRTRGLGHNRILRDEQVIAACIRFLKTGRL